MDPRHQHDARRSISLQYPSNPSLPQVAAVFGLAQFTDKVLTLIESRDKSALRCAAPLFKHCVDSSSNGFKSVRLGEPPALQSCSYAVGYSPWQIGSVENSLLLCPGLPVWMERLIYALNSPQDAKAACMQLLSQPVKNYASLRALELSEGRQFLSQSYHAELQASSDPYFGSQFSQAPHQGIYHRGASTTSTVSTLDFTELLLAATCSCSSLQNVNGERMVLLLCLSHSHVYSVRE